MKKLNGTRRLSPPERWRLKIKRLFGFICYVCEATDNLQAHHILNKYEYPQFARSIFNGVCVCRNCHRALHLHKLNNYETKN